MRVRRSFSWTPPNETRTLSPTPSGAVRRFVTNVSMSPFVRASALRVDVCIVGQQIEVAGYGKAGLPLWQEAIEKGSNGPLGVLLRSDWKHQ
jgi:hypothetical protein